MYGKLNRETWEVEQVEAWEPGLFDSNQLARTVVGDYLVSTVFLPLDHGRYTGTPVHFESYVFAQKDGEISDWSEKAGSRAITYAQVMEIHEDYVKRLKEGWIPSY